MKTRNSCRISGGDLQTIFDMGDTYVIDFVNSPEDSLKAEKCPLELTYCEDSKLVQLRHSASFDKLFSNY
jgi:hypothetical protein